MKKLLVLLAVLAIPFGSFWIYLNFNYTTPIFMNHSLDASRVKTYAAVSPENFYRQMQFIKKNGNKVISLSEYCRLLQNNEPVPRKSVVITFDDGYKDNLNGVEALKEFGYPATIFLVVNKIGAKGHLSHSDIKIFLRDYDIEIGSHTSSHAYLPDTPDSDLKKEIFSSKAKLANLFRTNVASIAYPIGGFNKKVLKEVENAGYLCACTTNRGFSKKLNHLTLRRIKITNRDSGIRLWGKLSGFYNIFKRPKKPY